MALHFRRVEEESIEEAILEHYKRRERWRKRRLSRWSPGVTYFSRSGFSINEGKFPNVHLSWWDGRRPWLYFYLALTDRLRVWFAVAPWTLKGTQRFRGGYGRQE